MGKRREIHQKKNKKKFLKFSIKRKIIIIIILSLLLFLSYGLYDQVVVPITSSKKPLSIMLVGSDMNAYRSDHYGGTKPEKTDAIMVMTYNPDLGRFIMTSIPRDTAVDYADGCGNIRGKINEVYPVNDNSIDCLERTVEGYLNIPVDYYVKVNMDQLEEIITTVGGVKVKAYAPDGVISQINVNNTKTYSWTNGQEYTMDGDEALTYSRARHDSTKDYGRGHRQQQVVEAAVKQMMNKGISLGTVQSMLKLVDTNMQALLIWNYYQTVSSYQNIFTKINKNQYLETTDLSNNIWKNMFEYFKYDNKEISSENIKSFQEYLQNNFSKKDIKKYFIEQHQFVNTTYGGFYITPDEDRADISNKLRKNLGLKEETPPAYKKEFGVNKFGKEITKSEKVSGQITDQEGTTYNIDPNTTYNQNNGYSSNPDTSDQTDDNNDTEVDTDGDGIPDKEDKYPNGEDKVDTDGDGTPDINDKYPNGEDKVDTDGDGIPDINDPYPNGEDEVDTDGDGIPDKEDPYPNGEDKIDTDGDGTLDKDDKYPNDPSKQ